MMSVVPVPGSLAIRRTIDGSRLVFGLCGELDLDSAPVLESELSNPVVASYRHIVVDLAELAFMDSRGLGALVRAQKTAQASQQAFSLRRGGRQVQRLFEVTGCSALFTFED